MLSARLFLSIIGMSLLASQAIAEDNVAQAQPQPHVFNWVFSGMVTNELGEHYGYYFEARRQSSQLQILSALVNIEKKSLVFIDDSQANISGDAEMNWQVGNAYLGFNSVTNRWILGVNTKEKFGFNFKIDAPLSSEASSSRIQTLKSGLTMLVEPTGRLNGHVISPDNNEEFVTAKSSWLREFMTKSHLPTPYPLTNVLCHFNDGSTFYAVHLLAPDALQSFVAKWHAASGLSKKMSQFVNIRHPSPEEWDLSAPFPAFHIRFSNLLSKSFQLSEVGAGVVDGKLNGFCTAAKEKV